MSEPTCGQCHHWHESPPAEPQRGVVMLSGQEPPATGTCREAPPQMTIFANGTQAVAYPLVTKEFPACSRCRAKEQV